MAKKIDMSKASVMDTTAKKTSSKSSKKQKKIDPAVKKRQEVKSQNKAMIKSALDTMKKTKSKHLFVYVDAVDTSLLPDKLPPDMHVIFFTKNPNYNYTGTHAYKEIINIPQLQLGRMGLIKITVLLALSSKLVLPEDKIVFLVGKAELNTLDTVMCFQINEESELLTGHSIADIPTIIVPAVFELTLNLAIVLGNKGKEGKPVGTIFVLGDEEKVMQLSKQMIINPFKGYEADERNILNPALKETLRELSSVDGAFVIAGNGEVISAGRYLGAAMEDSEIPRGLGSRHMAAAGITALTNAIAIVISESTGDVRIFRSGKIIMAIEKPTH